MPVITTADGTEIFYKDWGSGQPIVFSHGWPHSGDDWDTQMLFFLRNGCRVVAHDRIQDTIGDLIGDLVGVPLGDGLRGEEVLTHMACFSCRKSGRRRA